ncbi:MAG: NADH-quinone oxidoreductase subunit L [Myxococcota bacterium]
MLDVVILLVPALPLLAAALLGVLWASGRTLAERTVSRMVCGAIGLSLVGSAFALTQVLTLHHGVEVRAWRWLESGRFTVDVAFLVDPLSGVMMTLVSLLCLVASWFARNYMHAEAGFTRFFALVSLFAGAMLVLVMANNYVVMFAGWELAGICSYLLIGYQHERTSAVQGATRAFITKRVAEVALVLGILLVFVQFGTVDYTRVFGAVGGLSTEMANVMALCLFLGAAGKAAQLPFATWLPRAMEGPTPSSALFYGGTMVSAGVYLVIRSQPIFNAAPNVLVMVAMVGVLTAVYGALVGWVQTDVKSILAHSVMTQLGLMFLACGLGAYTAAVHHLVAHAVFSTLLFLTAPSILLRLRDASPREHGDRHQMTTPQWLFILGVAGLMAMPFVSGWWETDERGAAFEDAGHVLLAFGAKAAFGTVVLSSRAVQRAFGGPLGSSVLRVMVISLVAVGLAVAVQQTVLAGGIDQGWFQRFMGGPDVKHGDVAPLLLHALMLVLLVALTVGWLGALYFDRQQPEVHGALMVRLRTLHAVALRRFHLEDLQERWLVAPLLRLGRWLDRVDRRVIDRAMGTPGPAQQVRSVLAQWEEHVATGGAVSSEGRGLGPARGLMGTLAEVAAAFSSALERYVIGMLVGRGVPQTSGLLGRALNGLEHVVGKPVVLGAVVAAGALMLLGVR